MSKPVAWKSFLDGYEIDTDMFFGNPVQKTVPSRRKEETTTFLAGKSFYGGTMRDAGTVLHLEKDDESILSPDDVNLASLGRHEIGLDDLISMALEIAYGDNLSFVSGILLGWGHTIKMSSKETAHCIWFAWKNKLYDTLTLLISWIFTSPFTFGL